MKFCGAFNHKRGEPCSNKAVVEMRGMEEFIKCIAPTHLLCGGHALAVHNIIRRTEAKHGPCWLPVQLVKLGGEQ